MKLLVAGLTARVVRQSGTVKLVQACLSGRKARESSFHHCRSALKLVQALLTTWKVGAGSFNYCRCPVNLVEYQTRSRMKFSPPWWCCEALGVLFKCQESETKLF